MFTVMGITGKVGGAVAENLLAAGKTVRGVVRDPAKAKAWADRGVELVQSAYYYVTGLAKAFAGAEGVFAIIIHRTLRRLRACRTRSARSRRSARRLSRRSPARPCSPVHLFRTTERAGADHVDPPDGAGHPHAAHPCGLSARGQFHGELAGSVGPHSCHGGDALLLCAAGRQISPGSHARHRPGGGQGPGREAGRASA